MDSKSPRTFLPKKGNYRNLIVYQKAECIYDITFYFAHRFLPAGDRTVDQMIQAARSGKQNIAEGHAASTTSAETEIRLTNVARASLQELLADYIDYLRVHNLQQWDTNSEKALQTRKVCAQHNDTAFYQAAIQQRSDETIANIAITLICQADVLFGRLLTRLQNDFVENGGIKEKMYAARTGYRQQQDALLNQLKQEVERLKQENQQLKQEIENLKQNR